MEQLKIIVSVALSLGGFSFVYGIYILCTHRIPYTKRGVIKSEDLKSFCLKEGFVFIGWGCISLLMTIYVALTNRVPEDYLIVISFIAMGALLIYRIRNNKCYMKNEDI